MTARLQPRRPRWREVAPDLDRRTALMPRPSTRTTTWPSGYAGPRCGSSLAPSGAGRSTGSKSTVRARGHRGDPMASMTAPRRRSAGWCDAARSRPARAGTRLLTGVHDMGCRLDHGLRADDEDLRGARMSPGGYRAW